MSTVNGARTEAPAPPSMSFLKLAGPGLIVAATGIGSGDVVSATVGGANYGVLLLWAIAATHVLISGPGRFSLDRMLGIAVF